MCIVLKYPDIYEIITCPFTSGENIHIHLPFIGLDR